MHGTFELLLRGAGPAGHRKIAVVRLLQRGCGDVQKAGVPGDDPPTAVP